MYVVVEQGGGFARKMSLEAPIFKKNLLKETFFAFEDKIVHYHQTPLNVKKNTLYLYRSVG